MTRMSKASLVPALFIALLLSGPGVARAQDSCQRARAQALEGHQALVFYLGGIPGSDATIHIAVTVDALGTGQAHGVAHIRDGSSNTVLFAEGDAVLSCADINLNGVAGVTQLLLTMRDVRTGDVVPLIIVPDDGEMDGDLDQVTIVIGNRTFVETVRVKPLFAFLALDDRVLPVNADPSSITGSPRSITSSTWASARIAGDGTDEPSPATLP